MADTGIQPIPVYPCVIVAAIHAGVVIASHDIDHPRHDDGCCGCLFVDSDGVITCNECGFQLGESNGDPCPIAPPEMLAPDPASRKKRGK